MDLVLLVGRLFCQKDARVHFGCICLGSLRVRVIMKERDLGKEGNSENPYTATSKRKIHVDKRRKATAIIKSCEMATAIIKSCEMATAIIKSCEMATAIIKSCEMATAIIKSCEMATAIIKSCEMATAIIKSCEMASGTPSEAEHSCSQGSSTPS